MKSLEPIQMYRCKWCGNVYHTKRHDCKFDPDKKNCFLCRHSIGITQERELYYVGEPYFECEKYDELEEMCLDEITYVEYVKKHKYNIDCPFFEILDDYKGKITVVESGKDRIQKRCEVDKDEKFYC